ncbi:inclusion body family protein [Pseudomonas sp. N3-W]|uniref:inclusion body family protein n=1 Tax=Pseudomonas sp. N3-W TaxID=2975049 RepID=UPI00217E7E4A|nr:inclusion body family protein [Pseudomonas sp. N3-W]UWF50696.1 inclusion body family protein [Pseudomonas sp. N3-W]
MTSEPIKSPSSEVTSANNVLLIVDAESLLSHYPTPSLEAENPTSIDAGFIFVAGENSVKNDSKLTLAARNGKTFHLRGRTVSLIAEHSVVFYDLAVGDAGVLSPPKLLVHTDLTVPAPDPANPDQPASHKADDYYWECSQLIPGVAACELSFMLVNQSCEVVGYFGWAVEVKLGAA